MQKDNEDLESSNQDQDNLLVEIYKSHIPSIQQIDWQRDILNIALFFLLGSLPFFVNISSNDGNSNSLMMFFAFVLSAVLSYFWFQKFKSFDILQSSKIDALLEIETKMQSYNFFQKTNFMNEVKNHKKLSFINETFILVYGFVICGLLLLMMLGDALKNEFQSMNQNLISAFLIVFFAIISIVVFVFLILEKHFYIFATIYASITFLLTTLFFVVVFEYILVAKNCNISKRCLSAKDILFFLSYINYLVLYIWIQIKVVSKRIKTEAFENFRKTIKRENKKVFKTIYKSGLSQTNIDIIVKKLENSSKGSAEKIAKNATVDDIVDIIETLQNIDIHKKSNKKGIALWRE